MTPKYLDDLFSNNRQFSSVEDCKDISEADVATDELCVNHATRNIESIASLSRLKKLCVSSMREDIVPLVAQLKALEILSIQYSPYNDLSPLAKLKKLKCLLLSNLKQLESIDFLHSMPGLRALEIQDLKQIADLSALRNLERLEELKIDSGGMRGEQITVASLAPLSCLQNLRYLWLYCHSEDGSLQPLSKLTGLKQLLMNGHYAWQEYAKLAACLKTTECRWLAKKYYELPYPTCKKCGGKKSMISPPGKGRRAFCGKCYPQKIEELIAAYDEQYAIGEAGKW